MVLSNGIKPLRLFFKDNVITHSKAIIFFNSGIRRDMNDEYLSDSLASLRMKSEGSDYQDFPDQLRRATSYISELNLEQKE